MASGPDLFVVCKKCGSEVSPYITECPYCGTRLRKRAPKLERGGVPKEPKAPRRRRATLGRLKPGEIPGIKGDRRPYATLSLVVASIVVTLGARAGLWRVDELVLLVTNTDEYYRTVTTLFVYGSTGYEIVALGAIFLFGWLLERRHGAWATLLVFFVGGAAGMFLAIAGDDVVIATGGNGAALALLAAWAMRDVLGRRRGIEDDSDLLGALAIAAILILLPLATEEASALAGLGGGLAGVVMGTLLARVPER
ncbi:MAG TPA: rhomboid family intramembrane serine protease [Solirubrobacteraceae bacterium]|nr:rhomboid family intramembrane serine protease [Solirubrobacteraceae bacterium]